jgi:capsule polysaccharide export protein KpsE/RkpR
VAIPRMQRPSFVIEAKILRLLVLVVLILVRFFFCSYYSPRSFVARALGSTAAREAAALGPGLLHLAAARSRAASAASW